MRTAHSMLREVERGVLRRMHAVLYIIGLVFFLFISPIAILYFGLIPFTYRLWLLAIYTVIVAVVAFRDQRTLRSLGLRTNNFTSFDRCEISGSKYQ